MKNYIESIEFVKKVGVNMGGGIFNIKPPKVKKYDFNKEIDEKIGNTPLYIHQSRPTFQLEYQDKKILRVGDIIYGKPFGKQRLVKTIGAVKTRRCKMAVDGYNYNDNQILKSVFEDIKYVLNNRKNDGNEIDLLVLHSIILYLNKFNGTRGVMYRGAYIKL